MRLDNRLEIRLGSNQRRELEILAAAKGWPLGVLVRDLLGRGVEGELSRQRRAGDVAQQPDG